MPIYAFECGSCGHQFDRLQKLSDPDPEFCPQCAAAGIRRQLTAPSFRLSGAGWYETDFKKDSDKKRNLTEKPEAKEKPDAKPVGTDSSVKSEAASTPKPEPAVAKKPSLPSEPS
jgi:putative FmdB family regulatory protein